MKIRESFSSSESCDMVHPPFDPPKLTVFTQVTQDEIGKIISKSPTKSCLFDPLPIFLIKECIDILLPSITKLINCSFREGLVPDRFKKAVVTPLIKKASLPVEDLKNYRPVSGLSFISKLVEPVVAKQLVNHIHRQGLNNSYQSAYKSSHTTETAFDTIDHSNLLSCLLDWFGVGGSALKWFSSYLTERFQSVKIGSTLSDLQKLLFGVPQSSVLGPLLSSLYTSPLSTLIGKHKGIKFHFYADDSQLYVHLSHMNASAAFDKLNRCLHNVKEWMSASKLKLNPDKTELILFGSKKQRERLNVCFPIDILGNSLHPTKSVRNLGVWFDSDFSFSKHVQNVCKSCFIQLRDFSNIRQFLTHDAAVSVANAFVSSQLDYCNSLFRSLSKSNLHILQSIQNSAGRIVTNSSKYTRITPVLRKFHWLPVQFHSEFKLATLVYKFIHTGFPKYLLHIYPHTTILTILDVVRVLPISLMYQNFNLKFTSPLSSLVSVSPLMLPLFGIRFLKTFVHHPLLPLLERNSKPISMQRLILLSSFSLMASPWCRPTSVPGLWICIWILSCCALESTTQWRLSTIKVKLELQKYCLKSHEMSLNYSLLLFRPMIWLFAPFLPFKFNSKRLNGWDFQVLLNVYFTIAVTTLKNVLKGSRKTWTGSPKTPTNLPPGSAFSLSWWNWDHKVYFHVYCIVLKEILLGIL